MPLQIVKKNEVSYMAELLVPAEEIFPGSAVKGDYTELESCYGRMLGKALAAGKKVLAVPFPRKSSPALSLGKLKERSVKAVRTFLETCEDALLVVLVDEGDGGSITEGWFPDLERRLDKRNDLLEAPGILANFSFFSHGSCETARPKEFSADEDFAEVCEDTGLNYSEESTKELRCCYKDSRLEEQDLEALLKRKTLTFSQLLLKMLDERAITEVEFYKRANMDRKLFSKMRNPNYKPSRNTVLAAIIGLRLSVEEAEQLMAAAGYGWNKGDRTDIIVRYFINKRIFDIDRVNMSLYDHGEKTLGARIS